MSFVKLALLAGLVFLVSVSDAKERQHESTEHIRLANGAYLQWTPCWFQAPPARPTQCAYFYPATDGSPIRLPVVVIRHRGAGHQTSPILYLAGGPGGSAWITDRQIDFWYAWLDDMQWPHDMVLFDPRGTGLSSPALKCPQSAEVTEQMLTTVADPQENLMREQAAARRCYQHLQAQDHDLKQYNTRAMAQDAHDLMRLLDPQPWNLFSVSYGTRVAMQIQRSYPQHIRSVILDSVYPTQINATLAWPALLDKSLERVFNDCAQNSACNTRYADLSGVFTQLLEQLRKQPLDLTLRHPLRDEALVVKLTDERLLYTLFDALYSWDSLARIPEVIYALRAGDTAPLMPLLQDHVQTLLDDSFSDAVFLSVECHETPPYTDTDYARELQRHARIARYLLPKEIPDICTQWPSGHASADFFEPINSPLPTLILAGELDPITPVEWAVETKQHYPNGYLQIFPGIGHSVISNDACAAQLTRAFLDQPQHTPRPDCLRNLSPASYLPAQMIAPIDATPPQTQE